VDAQDPSEPSRLGLFTEDLPIESDHLGSLRKPLGSGFLPECVDDACTSLAATLPVLPNFGREHSFGGENGGV